MDFHMSTKVCNIYLSEVRNGQKKTWKDSYCNRDKIEQAMMEDDRLVVNSTFYIRLLGSLKYLATTRLDAMYVVSYILIFMEYPKESH